MGQREATWLSERQEVRGAAELFRLSVGQDEEVVVSTSWVVVQVWDSLPDRKDFSQS